MGHFVEIIKALAWPVTAFVLALIFKGELSGLLSRLSSVKVKNFLEAKFRKELREAEPQVEGIRKAAGAERSRESALEEEVRGELLRTAEVSPRVAILEAWRFLEIAALVAAKEAGVEINPLRPVYSFVQELVHERIFSDDALLLFDKFRGLRNDALYAPEFVLEQSEAEKYVDLALRLARGLFDAANALTLSKR
jgi:hypothetical protein